MLVKYDQQIVQQSTDVSAVLLASRIQHHTKTLHRIVRKSSGVKSTSNPEPLIVNLYLLLQVIQEVEVFMKMG